MCVILVQSYLSVSMRTINQGQLANCQIIVDRKFHKNTVDGFEMPQEIKIRLLNRNNSLNTVSLSFFRTILKNVKQLCFLDKTNSISLV